MKRLLLGMMMVGLTWAAGAPAFAQTIPPGVCTTDPTFNLSNNSGLISQIIGNITGMLYAPNGVAATLFSNITQGNGFFQAIGSALALYVIIYSLSFMLGIVQVTVIDFAMRVIKMGVVMVFINSNAWDWFYNTAGVFFNQGADWLIGVSIGIALGAGAPVNPMAPFTMVDQAISQALSAKMFVTMMAVLTTGPYGMLIALLIFISLGTFVASLFQAIWVYLMALVVRAFLFGIAPIFVPMLLFSKTQHLFYNWLNQLVNTMLQPVFLFTFFSFFLQLMMAAMNSILQVPVCVMPGTGLFRGTPMDEQLWRFTVNGAPYGGAWGWNGPVDFPGQPFPIDITNVLMFLILVQLAWRFNSIALNVAREISSASMNLNMQGAFSNFLDPSQKFGSFGGAGKAASGAKNAAAAGGAGAGGAAGNAAGGAVAEFKEQVKKQVGGGGGGDAPAPKKPAAPSDPKKPAINQGAPRKPFEPKE